MANRRLIKLCHVLVEGCYYICTTIGGSCIYCYDKNYPKAFQTHTMCNCHISEYKEQAEIYRIN
jgi:hypothetical protein